MTMTDFNIAELRKLAEQALDHIDDICLGKAQWTMKVPARETDSDMLFSAVASGLCEALDRLERAEAAIERVRALCSEVFSDILSDDFDITDWQRYENSFPVELLAALGTEDE